AWIGPARRLADPGFATELRASIAAAPPLPPVVFEATALPADRATRVTVYEIVPGTSLVTFVATDEIRDEAAARAALAALGYAGAPVESSDRSWVYEAPPPPAEAAAKLPPPRRRR